MMRIRLQVIQSLSSLVDTFDADPSSLRVSRSIAEYRLLVQHRRAHDAEEHIVGHRLKVD